MGVHTGAVILEQRLGHEGDYLVVAPGDVLDDVLVHHALVGHYGQGIVLHVDLGLPAAGHFVVVGLDADPQVEQVHHHLGAQVLLGVMRRHGEIPFLIARLVAQVRPFVAACVPFALIGVDEVVAKVDALVKPDIIEDKEFHFRAPETGVRDTG